MVKLEQSRGTSGESATRIFGSESMGLLFSKFQAAVIRSGFELEDMIFEETPKTIHTTLTALIDPTRDVSQFPPIQVVFKPTRPNPDNPDKSIQADLLIVDNVKRTFMLVEIKEGFIFDTKKADGELSSLKSITSWLAQEFAYRTSYFLCSFNQENKEAIVAGAKKRFDINHVLTGRELCQIIGINFEALKQKRQADQAGNRTYFLNGLLAIPEIRAEIIALLGVDHGPQQE